jgi:hypothetical protein
MSDHYLDNKINRTRSLMHYYKSKPDLLSRCQAEVLANELAQLKKQKKSMLNDRKVHIFLQRHPEYKEVFK